MPRQFKPPKPVRMPDRMFETRSDAWEAAGLSVDYSQQTVKRARREFCVLVPLFIAILVFWGHHWEILRNIGWFKHHEKAVHVPLQVLVILALIFVGWRLARDLSRLVGPTFFRRMDPATAGTVGFVIRILVVIVFALIALSIAGTGIKALAVGGGFTAVVVGLAAQQTLGNAFAGMVLLTARPFRVGERVRLQAGALGGQLDGIVSELGLLYTVLSVGNERMMIPNNGVLAAVVVPLKDPEAVDVRVRLTHGMRPSQVQAMLDQDVATPSAKSVLLEEVDGSDVVVRVKATPEAPEDGAQLADEIMKVLGSVTDEHRTNGNGNGGGSSPGRAG
jgi:small conductance mechanosensitive channel